MNPYRQTIVEGASLSEAEQLRLAQFQEKLSDVQAQLLQWKNDGTLPLLSLPEQQDDLDELETIAANIRDKATGLVVFGTGGSSLGGQTVCELRSNDFPIHFLDNLDPHTMDKFFARPDAAQMHYLMISKSGGTLETLTQTLVTMQFLEKKNGKQAIKDQCHILTMPGDRPLRELADQYDIPVLDHHPDVGGRYSVLSSVGLLPAAVLGVDIRAIRAGAAQVMQAVEKNVDASPLSGAAWQAALMPARPISVMMPYADRLRKFSLWYQQLWAESLGKNGQGSTPAAALGAVDQHSQLQLYLGGPRDKALTLITVPHEKKGPAIPTPDFAGHDYLKGKRLGDVIAALQHGTIETMKQHRLPLRLMAIDAVDAQTLGALLMHFMLETMAAAELLGLNAFDQPAVEDSKQIARDTLRNGLKDEAA